jgi:hypothetical protein
MRRAAAILLPLVLLAGCGGSSGSSSSSGSSGTRSGSTGAAAPPQQLPAGFAAAAHPRASQFPAAGGRTLQQIAGAARPGYNVGLATSVFTPGTNRLAFGLIGPGNRFVTAPTAVYVARKPGAPARGPFLAPADSMVVQPQFEERGGRDGGLANLKAVLAAQVPLPSAGTWYVLVVSRQGKKLVGGTTQIGVQPSNPIPAVGDRPPALDTPTVASVGGAKNLGKIDTRVPHDDMHQVSFKDVLGRKPVVLVVATPALCQSRVCGPVVDIVLQVQKRYGNRVAFIHQEVYKDNDVAKGYRPQLTALHLRTEPWIFFVDRYGRIAARLEGAMGLREVDAGVRAALR